MFKKATGAMVYLNAPSSSLLRYFSLLIILRKKIKLLLLMSVTSLDKSLYLFLQHINTYPTHLSVVQIVRVYQQFLFYYWHHSIPTLLPKCFKNKHLNIKQWMYLKSEYFFLKYVKFWKVCINISKLNVLSVSSWLSKPEETRGRYIPKSIYKTLTLVFSLLTSSSALATFNRLCKIQLCTSNI